MGAPKTSFGMSGISSSTGAAGRESCSRKLVSRELVAIAMEVAESRRPQQRRLTPRQRPQ